MDGRELKEIRKKLGMTQGQLAAKLGYSTYIQICEKERGRSKVAKHDEIILEYLLKESGE